MPALLKHRRVVTDEWSLPPGQRNPPWCMYSPQARAHIEEVRARAHDYTVSVEFRHQFWFTEKHRDKTLEFEKERGLVNVVLDEPQGFTNSIGAHWVMANPRLAVVRRHGRNAKTWNIKGAVSVSARSDYDHPESELLGLASSIRELSEKVSLTHVVFKSNFEDQGQRNAATLVRMLELARWLDDGSGFCNG